MESSLNMLDGQRGFCYGRRKSRDVKHVSSVQIDTKFCMVNFCGIYVDRFDIIFLQMFGYNSF